APARLTRFREKYSLLAKLGIDRLLVVNFTPAFAALEPEHFIEQLLLRKLGVEHLIVGDDFCFGKQRRGNYETLLIASERHQFSLCNTSSLILGHQRISSTLIRQALANDELTAAEQMLGRPFALTGRVRHGRKLGRDLGFPTANVFLYRRKLPVNGVYAITANTVFGRFLGVANIGHRPTVQGQRQQLEAHLFDFKGDLYGSQIEVTLCKKLRNEQRFDGLAALQQQIAADVAAAKAFFQHDVADAARVTIDKTEQNG
ncbi:MAG TPA: bifunctional riboflavin kinase/FAD synthetase, partial [Rheinheimera sp.]|nr:bifunctional riboflavin kinase/FAD synthetase [Rheinheimera sp.]